MATVRCSPEAKQKIEETKQRLGLESQAAALDHLLETKTLESDTETFVTVSDVEAIVDTKVENKVEELAASGRY